MKRAADEEALSWGDENDPTYVAPELDDPEEEAEPAAEVSAQPEVDATPEVAAAAPEAAAAPGVDTATVDAAGPRRRASTPAQPEAFSYAKVEGADSERDDEGGQPLSSAALIAFGLFAGILFLYTIGWLVGFLRNPPTGDGLGGIVQAVLAVLTIVAPALWFVGTLLLGRTASVRTRILWLIIGVIVLVPWPFVTGY